MFRIVFMVEDRDLARALHALAGVARQMEPPVPVVNAATAASGRIIAATGGSAAEVARDVIVKSQALEITKKQLGAILATNGFRESSVDWVRKKLFAAGFLRSSKRRGVFLVRKNG